MKRIKLSLFIILLISSCTTNTAPHQETSTEQIKQVDQQLRHVVLFKFKATATAADIKKVEEAFTALPSEIKEIKAFEWGINNSPEGLEKGFTHCFTLTFDSEAGRAVYLPHPAHKAFGKVLEPYLDDVLVVDYWTK